MRPEERVGTHSCGSCGAGGTRETCASASWLHGTKTSPLNDVTVSPMKPVLPRYFSIPNCNCRLDIQYLASLFLPSIRYLLFKKRNQLEFVGICEKNRFITIYHIHLRSIEISKDSRFSISMFNLKQLKF